MGDAYRGPPGPASALDTSHRGEHMDAALGPSAGDVRVRVTTFAEGMVADLVQLILTKGDITSNTAAAGSVLGATIIQACWTYLNHVDGGLSGGPEIVYGVVFAKIFQYLKANPAICSDQIKNTIKQNIRDLLATNQFMHSNMYFDQTTNPDIGRVKPEDLLSGPDKVQSKYPTTPTTTTLRILSRLVDRLEL